MMTDGLKLQLLGNLIVEKNGKALSGFRSQKAPILFAYLAYTQLPHRREVLADLLWDARSTRQSLSNLRTILAQLRKSLGEYLDITHQTLAFNPKQPHTLDTHTLQSILTKSLQIETLDIAMAESLDSALKLYRGDLLEHVLVENATRFNEWLVTERELIRQQVMHGYQKLTAFHLNSGAYHAGLLITGRWLKLDTLNELAHQQHMHLLALNNQRTLALQQYQICCDMLVNEFGVEPAPATTQLYEAIQAGKVGRPNPMTPQINNTPPPEQIPNNLPAEFNTFIGQETVIRVIQDHLQHAEKPLITLTGIGGSGKTRLAIHVAHQQLGNYQDGIWFIDLSGVTAAADVPLQVAQILGIDSPEPLEPILNYIRNRQMLMIFDNFEYVLAARHFVHQLITTTHRSKILVTSQIPLNLYGEQTITVDPLPLPDLEALPDHTDSILKNEAIRLFVERAQERRHDYVLTPDQIYDVAQICHLLDGLPLAIELVAVRSYLLSPADMLRQLIDGSKFDYLAHSYANRPQRHHNLRNTFNWSYERLDAQLQQVFMQLSVFAGSFSIKAAQDILRQIDSDQHGSRTIVDCIHALVENSLLQTVNLRSHESRFRMLDTIRSYARELLEQTNLHDAMFQAHATYFQMRATQVVTESRIFTDEKGDWTVELEQDFLNYSQAFESPIILTEYLNQITTSTELQLNNHQQLLDQFLTSSATDKQTTSEEFPIGISASIDIECEPEVVFEYMVDPDKLPLWATVWESINYITDGEPQVGSRFEHENIIFGKHLTGIAEIIEFEPGRKKVSQLVSNPELGRTTFLCEPIATGTRATLKHEATDLSLLIRVVKPVVIFLIKNSLRKWLENLKTLLEEL